MIIKPVRNILAGYDVRFRFNPFTDKRLPTINATSLYVHIPFCKSLCPYCPYNRIPYDEKLIRPFTDALIKEIGYYAGHNASASISSVYFGGGTPTVIGNELKRITDALHRNFTINDDFAIETNPNDINSQTIALLKECGFQSISIGVQSFNDKMLECIGRKYDADTAKASLQLIRNAGFKSVNMDLLFALPNQSEQDLQHDLEGAVEFATDQITCYPLFTFPYSEISIYKQHRHVKSPNIMLRRRMYYQLYEYLESKGYRRCSVWSFKKENESSRYSSVTRERYMGFGPSAGSYYENLFTLNTFSVPDYIEAINKRGHAVALSMHFSRRLAVLYDFYWRIYDTYIPKMRTLRNTNYNIETEPRVKTIILFMRIMKWIKKNKNGYELTKSGSMWAHLIQNMFSLNAISRVWSAGKKTPWPPIINF